MPIVKSIAIHDNVRATLRYILNPEKTEGLFLCNSLNCFTNAEDAYLNMKYIYENYTHHKFNEPLPAVGKRRVKAIHYIQSFKPDPNLTPELYPKSVRGQRTSCHRYSHRQGSLSQPHSDKHLRH